MAEGFISRKGGLSTETTVAPTLNFVSKTDSEIVFTITNNDAATVDIFWELADNTPDQNQLTLTSGQTSGNLTLSGLNELTTYTIFAFANAANKLGSTTVSLTTTTDEKVYKISIDHNKIDSNLTDFPLTVKLTSSNINWSDLDSDSGNVYFIDDADNILNHEVEYFNNTGQNAVYHVKVPSVSSTVDTIIKLKINGSGYQSGNNPTNTWDSNYTLVHHFGASLTDSSGTGNNATLHGSPTVVSTPVGQGRFYDSDSEHITFGDDPSIKTQNLTWLFLQKRDNPAESLDGGMCYGNIFTTPAGYSVWMQNSDSNLGWGISNGSSREALTNYTYTSTDWLCFHLSVGNNITGYVNGVQFESINRTFTIDYNLSVSYLERLVVGGRAESNEYSLRGTVDEIRISNIERSAAWVKAEYESLFDNLINIS